MKYIWERKNWHILACNKAVLLESLSRLRVAQGKLLGRVASLDIGLETEAQASVLAEEAMRTAEIEGQRLNKESVRSSVARRLGLPQGWAARTEASTVWSMFF